MIYKLIKPLPLTGCMLITESSPEATSLLQELEGMGFKSDDTPSLVTGTYNCLKWSTISLTPLYKSYHWTHRWSVLVDLPLVGGGTHSIPVSQPTEEDDLDFHSHFQLKHQYRGHKLKRFGL